MKIYNIHPTHDNHSHKEVIERPFVNASNDKVFKPEHTGLKNAEKVGGIFLALIVVLWVVAYIFG